MFCRWPKTRKGDGKHRISKQRFCFSLFEVTLQRWILRRFNLWLYIHINQQCIIEAWAEKQQRIDQAARRETTWMRKINKKLFFSKFIFLWPMAVDISQASLSKVLCWWLPLLSRSRIWRHNGQHRTVDEHQQRVPLCILFVRCRHNGISHFTHIFRPRACAWRWTN